MSQLVLHVWPGRWDLPSIDPSCLTAILYLQLAIPGHFCISECTNPDLSPTGQLPFLTHLHNIISPLPSILKYISACLPLEKLPAPDLDSYLSASEKSQQVAWCAHVEANLGDLVTHMFYSLNENWSRLTYPTLANMLPIPQRYYVPARMRESFRPRLEAVQLWNLPGIEQEEEKPHFWKREKLREPTESERKEKFKSVFEREKVLEKARSSLDKYARLLGEKRYFFSDRPTTIDVYIASHILLLIDAPFPDPLLQTLLKESYPTLTAHARQIHLQAFPATGSNIPLLPSQSYTLRALIPLPPAKTRKSNPKPKSEDDIRFDRMRWGWIAVAVFSAVYYIAQSGIIQAVRNLDNVEKGEILYVDDDEE